MIANETENDFIYNNANKNKEKQRQKLDHSSKPETNSTDVSRNFNNNYNYKANSNSPFSHIQNNENYNFKNNNYNDHYLKFEKTDANLENKLVIENEKHEQISNRNNKLRDFLKKIKMENRNASDKYPYERISN